MILFPDPMAATLAILRALPDTGATFGTKRLDDFAEDAVPALPYTMVRSDGTFDLRRVAQRATVRVVVWADTEAAGVALAGRLHASLLAYEGGPDVRGFGPLTGPLPTDDPDTGRPICSFTVSARLRAT